MRLVVTNSLRKVYIGMALLDMVYLIGSIGIAYIQLLILLYLLCIVLLVIGLLLIIIINYYYKYGSCSHD